MKKAICIILLPFILFSCETTNKQSYPSSDEIFLEWEFLGNNITEGHFSSKFTLENTSKIALGNEGWELRFSQMMTEVIQSSVTGNVKIEHINGDLSRISPTKDFMLSPGETVEIRFNRPWRLLKENEAPLGPFMVYYDENVEELASEAIEHYHIKSFPALDKVFPAEADIPLPDANWVYEQNIHQVKLDHSSIGKIIPSPVSANYSGTSFTIGQGLMIHFDSSLKNEASYLAVMLEMVLGFAPSAMEGSHGGSNIIRLTTDKSKVQESEGYELKSNSQEGVTITGNNPTGVFYGIQSLLAMIPVEAWNHQESSIELEVSEIVDHPAFSYRGMHLDIARNFIEPEAIKKLIRTMAFYKLNKLHLHVSDDEGWRLEIPSFPELTEIGGYRGHTEDLRDHLSPAYGSGPTPDPEISHGSGYLSRQVFIEILQMAKDHHIEVIPEINYPGHARAAIYAMEARYDRLMNEGKEEEAKKFRLIDPEDASRYNSAQNFDDNVVCVCTEAPYLFYETVVDEIIEMYQEAGLKMKMFHAGGDEVPVGSWTGSPICTEFLKAHPEVDGVENLQAYCEGRLFEILDRKGLVMAGWEEIAMMKDTDGRWIPNPEFVGSEMLPYVWNNLDENLDLGNRLANAGYPVILCNATNFYFDFSYTHHPAEPGHYWGGIVNTRRAFESYPYDVFKSVLNDRYWRPIDSNDSFMGLEKLEPEAKTLIKGLQGGLWSEFIKGGEMLEYFYMPKMLGLVERAWAGHQEWKSVEHAWNDFANIIGQREMPRLDYLFGGYHYRLPPPGGKIMEGMLYANIDFPGLTIRYTIDGSEPGIDSPIYSDPMEVSGPVKLRSFDTRGRGSRVSEVQ